MTFHEHKSDAFIYVKENSWSRPEAELLNDHIIFEIFMDACIQIVEFWVVTPFKLLCGCQSFGEKCTMIYVSKFDTFLQIHKSETRRQQYEF